MKLKEKVLNSGVQLARGLPCVCLVVCLLLGNTGLAEVLASQPDEQATPSSLRTEGDEVTDMVEEALRAYRAGRYSVAADLLRQAGAVVGQLQLAELSKLFPEPQEGWQRFDPALHEEEAFAQFLKMGITEGAARLYQRPEEPDKSVQLVLVRNPGGMLGMLLEAVNMLTGASAASRKPVELASKSTQLICDAKQTCHLLLSLDQDMVFIAYGKGVSADQIMHYCRGFDFSGLKALQAAAPASTQQNHSGQSKP
jgi:hypothetical protein